MNFNSPIVAIRSLISPHHAENIEPKILNIIWNLGKRCNYDCSYCSPTTHDWSSPHRPVEDVKNFIKKLEEHCEYTGKTFKISLSGGEPYVHPDILEIFRIIKQSPKCDPILTVVTNGSLPLDLYVKSLNWVSNMTISLHLERPDHEIFDKLEKIKNLNKISDKWITVQVMCLPGKLEFIKKHIEPFFVMHSIKYTLRRIRPLAKIQIKTENKDILIPVSEKSRREMIKEDFSLEFKAGFKRVMKKLAQEQITEEYQFEKFYSTEELEYLKNNEPQVSWENIGVWNQAGEYFTTNSDILGSKALHKFTGWKCFIGVDCIYVDIDGEIYRGSCQSGGSIGNISGDIHFPEECLSCDKNWCLSNPDQTTRKSLPDYLHLITKS